MPKRHRDLALVVGVCAVALALAGVGKGCRAFWHDRASFLCHSDIRALYPLRELDRDLFPYLGGDLIRVPRTDRPWPPFELQPVGGANEYPVLTGILMWLPSIVSDGADAYLLASVVLLAPFGLATAWLLGRMTGRRALLWSASPILVLYAFHNWDLAVVAASIAGIWCWWRGRPVAAAACFGVGGALKLYPLLFLVPMVLEHLHAGDRRGALRTAAAGVGTAALVNLPILLINPPGWAVPYRFQALRPPNYDSLWGELADRRGGGPRRRRGGDGAPGSPRRVVSVPAGVRGAPRRVPPREQGALAAVRAVAPAVLRPPGGPARLVRPVRRGEPAHVRLDLRGLRLEPPRPGRPRDLVRVDQGRHVPPPGDRVHASASRRRAGDGAAGARSVDRALTPFALVTYPSSGSRIARAPRRKSQPAMR
jgi:hypothetical protein